MSDGPANLAVKLMARNAEIKRLRADNAAMLALLKELIDIEGPQPGTAEWARRVRAAIQKAETP